MSESKFVSHVPCPACGSSDAGALYTDGHIHCHKCAAHSKAGGTPAAPPTPRSTAPVSLLEIEPIPLTRRKIDLATCELWKYGEATYKGQKVQVATYCDAKGTPVAQKLRFPNKDFLVLGSISEAGLYGQQLWKPGGKMIVITEGEIDALSLSQVNGNRWPVVSIPSGAAGAAGAIRKQLEYLASFDAVVLMFDMDEPGRKAALECAELFEPGKARIATLALKDANDMLKAGRVKELISSMWEAKPYTPAGIVSSADIWERIIVNPNDSALPYPWPCVNRIALGVREKEIVLLTAGTGCGKSTFAAELAYAINMKSGETLGYIALEEDLRQSGLRFMSIHANKRLHMDPLPADQLRPIFDATLGRKDKLFFFDHWGSIDPDQLANRIRFMVRGLGCKTIILDHISIVISGIADGEERRLIDNVMTMLRKLTQELGCRLIIISHLRKGNGESSHEEGGRVTLDDLRGSGTLKQIPDIILGLERDQQDDENKNEMTVRVLKNRFTGETGVAGTLNYNPITGRLLEGQPPQPAPQRKKAASPPTPAPAPAGQASGDDPF